MNATVETSEYHDAPPLMHDFAYHMENGVPVLDA